MINPHVLQAIATLIEQKKAPAMASVKAKVSHRASMREIIETLQAYKADPSLIKDLPPTPVEKNSQMKNEKALLERVDILERQQDALTQQLHELTLRLNTLESN